MGILSVVSVVACVAGGARADEYVAPPAESVTNYSATVMPCKIKQEDRSRVYCTGDLLAKKSLRELTILRNTIYARQGWDGYRKEWLKAYFHAEPWFKPNPKFTYKLLSDADRKNAHFIGAQEQSFGTDELQTMKDRVLARHKGENGKPDGLLTAEDKVELGLIARAMGSFALDDASRDKAAESLDRVLPVKELRQLSLRDLRLLRNTIYARRGRPFKSEVLRDHFTGLDWYKVNPAYSDKLLTKNDTRNIGLIRTVENEFGGALSDEDWLTEPAVDGA